MNNLARWVSKSWLLAFWVVDRLNLSSRNGLLREEVVLPLLSVRRCLRWSPCGRICFTSSAIALNWSMKILEEYKFLFFYFNHWINTYMYMFFIQWINTYMHLFRTSKAYRTLIFELVKTGIQTDTLNFQFFFFLMSQFSILNQQTRTQNFSGNEDDAPTSWRNKSTNMWTSLGSLCWRKFESIRKVECHTISHQMLSECSEYSYMHWPWPN